MLSHLKKRKKEKLTSRKFELAAFPKDCRRVPTFPILLTQNVPVFKFKNKCKAGTFLIYMPKGELVEQLMPIMTGHCAHLPGLMKDVHIVHP